MRTILILNDGTEIESNNEDLGFWIKLVKKNNFTIVGMSATPINKINKIK